MKTITDIKGVYASGIHCGIKSGSDKKDLAFIYIPQCVASAGTFTRNKFRAPCLDYTSNCIQSGTLKAAIINSGNANAATGKQGFKNAARTAAVAAKHLHLAPEEVGIASTGIIGVQLPMDRLEAGLETLLAEVTAANGHAAAEAIMTTDLTMKEVYVQAEIAGKVITVAGFAKGSGMIAPNMGTMLCYLVTDLKVEQELLQTLLQNAVDDSFNMVTVDSDTSTNDMVLLFSSGEHKLDLGHRQSVERFTELLLDACVALSKMIARDGEGATKLIQTTVRGARSLRDARRCALNIANSPLIKTAIHGSDPNWGRVMMAVGKDTEVEVNPDVVDLYFGSEKIFEQGAALSFDRTKLVEILRQENVEIVVDLNLGDATATSWGCDLTKGYIDINTAYS